MPNAYDGLPGGITYPATMAITAVTPTNPMVITVSGSLPAQFTTPSPAGPMVTIFGVTGFTSAVNGTYPATVTGGSTFSIPVNGIASGAYGGSGGVVQPLYMVDGNAGVGGSPGYTYPVDGDPDNGASVAVWAQITGDRTSFLSVQTGYLKCAGRVVFRQADTTGLTWAGFSSGVTTGWQTSFPTFGALTPQSMELGSLSVISAAGPYVVGGINAQDLIRVSLSTGYLGTSALVTRVGIYSAPGVPGSSPPVFGTYTLASTSSRSTGGAYAGGAEAPFSTAVWIPHPSPGDLFVFPNFFSTTTNGGAVVGLINDTELTIEAWRITGVPQ